MVQVIFWWRSFNLVISDKRTYGNIQRMQRPEIG